MMSIKGKNSKSLSKPKKKKKPKKVMPEYILNHPLKNQRFYIPKKYTVNIQKRKKRNKSYNFISENSWKKNTGLNQALTNSLIQVPKDIENFKMQT